MTKSLLLAPEFEGDVAHFWEDDGQGGGVITSVQDVAPILELNKAMANHNDGYGETREIRRVAFVPTIVRDFWLATEGWDAWRPDLYADKLAQKFNDPDWAFLRTAPGRIGSQNGHLR